MNDTYTIVHLPDENTFGVVISKGAHFSIVRYSLDGITYETEVLNDNFIELHEINVGYEEE